MSVQHRRKYDPDFKCNIVLLSQEEGRTVNEVAENLGIGKNLLYRWRREYLSREAFVFPGNGREPLSFQEQRIKELNTLPPLIFLIYFVYCLFSSCCS